MLRQLKYQSARALFLTSSRSLFSYFLVAGSSSKPLSQNILLRVACCFASYNTRARALFLTRREQQQVTLQNILLRVRLVRLSPVAEEAVYCVQVGLGGGVRHVRVRRFADVLPPGELVLDTDRYLAQGIDSGCHAATDET